jgi:hypothetical protein
VPATIRSGHGAVGDRLQRGHALDGQRRGARAVDAGAHRGEHRAEVDDLRLARGVVDDRRPSASTGGHDQVPRWPRPRGSPARCWCPSAAGGGDQKPCSLGWWRRAAPGPEMCMFQPARADRVTAGQRPPLAEPHGRRAGPATLIEARILRTRS